MCNTKNDSAKVGREMINRGQTVYEVFPDLVEKYPPKMAVPGRCLVSGQELSPDQMNPPGLTPRHMTDDAYQAIINRQDRADIFCNAWRSH